MTRSEAALEECDPQGMARDPLGPHVIGVDIMAEDAGFAGGLVDQAREDADDRGLPRPVGPEQGAEIPGLDFKVDSLKGPRAAGVCLRQILDADGVHILMRDRPLFHGVT